MIKPYVNFLRRLLLISDLIIVTCVLPFSIAIHNRFSILKNSNIIDFFYQNLNFNLFYYSPMYLWIIPSWIFTLYYFKSYDSFRTKMIKEMISSIVQASLVVSIIFSSIFWFFQFEGVGYSLVFIYPSISLLTLSIFRIIIIYIFRLIRAFGYNLRNIILVGNDERAYSHFCVLKQHKEWGYNITGLVTLEKGDALKDDLFQLPILGSVQEMSKILEQIPVDEVFFSISPKYIEKIESAVVACELIGVKAHLAADFFSLKVSKNHLSHFYSLPVLTFSPVTNNYSALVLKRLIDICVSAIGLILFLPFGILIAFLIKLESKGNVFFIQRRVGMNGRIFPMLKFRTMVQNAQAIQKQILAKNEQDGPVFKMKNDPRITKFGKLLRKSSLDEMPQLINVLVGQMSLVGPRPPIQSEVDKYLPWQRRRLSMRPGITCIWQVSGRNDIGFEKWMELDLKYVDEWSLGLDFELLLKTIPAVLFAKGNH